MRAAGDLRRRWPPRAGANFVRGGRGRGWGPGTRYLGTGAQSAPAGARAAAPGPGAAWSSARGGRGAGLLLSRARPGPRLPGTAPGGYARAPGMARPQGAALPQTQAAGAGGASSARPCALSGARPCAAGELGAAGAQRPAPAPAAPHLARVAPAPPPPPRLLRPSSRPIAVAPPPPPPLPAPAAGRPSARDRVSEPRAPGGGRGGGGRAGPEKGAGPRRRPGPGRPPSHRRRDVPLPGGPAEGRRASQAWRDPRRWSGAWVRTGPPEGAPAGQKHTDRGVFGPSGGSSQGRRVGETGEGPWNGAATSGGGAVFAGDRDCKAERRREVLG